MAHFLAQGLEEAAFLRATVEIGGSHARYAPWYGRGFIQLTGKANYKRYGEYRGFPTSHPSALPKWSAVGWDVDALIATTDLVFNADACVDTAGHFWLTACCLSKSDRGVDAGSGVSISRAVNGGYTPLDINGLELRLANMMHIKYVLTDVIRPSAPAGTGPVESIAFTWRADEVMHTVTDSAGKTHTTHANSKSWTVSAPLTPQQP